jgi:hypothetical protein
MKRRQFVAATGLLLATSQFANAQAMADFRRRTETTKGDPNGAEETMTLTPAERAAINSFTAAPPPAERAFYPKVDASRLFGTQLLLVAGNEAAEKVSRKTKPERIAEYLALFGLDASKHPYAFCAAGLSWAICKAYCDVITADNPGKYPGFDYLHGNRADIFRNTLKAISSNYIRPDPLVQDMADDAKNRKIWVARPVVPKPGWLVFYNWSGGTHCDHIGIVETADNKSLHTIEFNTSDTDFVNGGCVAKKDRTAYLHDVLGYAKTY